MKELLMVDDLINKRPTFHEAADGNLYWADSDGTTYQITSILELPLPAVVGTVYAIFDIRNLDEMRYVGATTRTVRVRFVSHLIEARVATKNLVDRPFYRWIREVGRENLAVRELQVVKEPDSLMAAEKAWIEYFSEKEGGHRLFNQVGMRPDLILDDHQEEKA